MKQKYDITGTDMGKTPMPTDYDNNNGKCKIHGKVISRKDLKEVGKSFLKNVDKALDKQPSPTELRKYRLIQGEVTGTYEGCANPVFQIQGEEFYYAENVEEEIAKLKQELAEKDKEIEKLWADIQAMNTIPKAKVQEVIDRNRTFLAYEGWGCLDKLKDDLKELLTAGEKDIKKIPVKHLCMDCWHKGQIQKDCPKCKGTGKGEQ